MNVSSSPYSSSACVLIIDDHQVVREGLKAGISISGFKVIGEAASKSEAFAQITHKNPDVIVVDLNLPDGSGLEIITWVRKVSMSTGIVVLTLNDDDDNLLAALHAGASAYVLKSAPLSEVIAAISHSIASPNSFSSRGLSGALARKKDRFGLTPRELQIFALLPSGMTSLKISTTFFITESTVKTHLSSIYRKLNVANRTEAVALGLKHGLLHN